MSREMLLHHEQSDEQLSRLETDLVEEVSELADQAWTRWNRAQLVTALDHLFRVLPTRFDLKESGGYLHEVVDEFPEWKEQVDTLWIEQALLYEDLREIRDHLQDVGDDEVDQGWVLFTVKEWIDRLRRHEDQEQELRHVTCHKC